MLISNALLIGAFAYASIHHLYLWHLSRRASLPLLVAIYCGMSAALGICLVGIGTAATIADGQRALDGRTITGLISVGTLAWMIAGVTGVAARRYLFAVSALLAAGLVAQLFGYRVAGSVVGISHVPMPWGESLTVLDRQPSARWFAGLIYSGLLSVYVFALVAGMRWARRDRVAGLLTATAGVSGILLIPVGALVDMGIVRSPYVGHIGNIVWILLTTFLMARDHAAREELLLASERQLAASEARYRTLIESAPEAIVVFDVDTGTFVDVNPKACALFGAFPDELRGLSPIALSPAVQPDGRATEVAARDYIEQAVTGGTPVFEWMHRTLDGRDIPCEVRLVRLPDPIRVLLRGSIADISERLKLEEQLRQSQKMEAIGQLAGGVAHDFNNLLTVISGSAEILQTKLPLSDPRHGLVKVISDASERAAWLTARLLAFGRRSVLAPQVIDLNALIGDTESILRRLIGENIWLRMELAPDVLHVRLDPGQWSQVVINLAVNARDAMPDGGSLLIHTTAVEGDAHFVAAHPSLSPGRYASFSVTDTGHGMAPDVTARIFEPFYTTKELGKGTGLGLAVVHGIVSQAGGAIDVATAPGGGTSFAVYLPRVEPTPARADEEHVAQDLGAGETILLVEDEDEVRELLEVALSEKGYKVFAASHGEDALRLLEASCPFVDLLMTDIVMPGRLNGPALAQSVRRRCPQVKVLYMSGYIDDPAFRSSGFAGGDEYLQKPFSLATVAQKTREILDRK